MPRFSLSAMAETCAIWAANMRAFFQPLEGPRTVISLVLKCTLWCYGITSQNASTLAFFPLNGGARPSHVVQMQSSASNLVQLFTGPIVLSPFLNARHCFLVLCDAIWRQFVCCVLC